MVIKDQDQVIIKGTIIGEDCIRFSKEVKNVGVWLDDSLQATEKYQPNTQHPYQQIHRNFITHSDIETGLLQ